MLRLVSAVAVVLALVVCQAAGAHAQDARERFQRGEAAYQRGDYNLAISEWQAAYATDPRPRIQYNIYQAHERLGSLPEAAEALQLYLQTADPGDPYYGDAQSRMTALQQRLRATGVRIVGGVEGASIDVDGQDWGRVPRPDRIPVNPGSHRIIVRLQGYQDFVSNVVVPAGRVVDITVEMQALGGDAPGPATPSTSASASASIDSDGPTDVTPWFIASGVLAAGAIASTVWIIDRSGELDGCNDLNNFCPNEDTVATQGNIAIGLTVALGVGAVGTLVYALIAGGDDDSSANPCAPSVRGGHCTLRF
jgi:hypothetical protein